jgi:hypothetical protein
MKIIITHAVEISPDATLADIRDVVLAASQSFVRETAPLGQAYLSSVKGTGLVLAGVVNERDLADMVVDAITR